MERDDLVEQAAQLIGSLRESPDGYIEEAKEVAEEIVDIALSSAPARPPSAAMIEAGEAFVRDFVLEFAWEGLSPGRRSSIVGGIYDAMCSASSPPSP